MVHSSVGHVDAERKASKICQALGTALESFMGPLCAFSLCCNKDKIQQKNRLSNYAGAHG